MGIAYILSEANSIKFNYSRNSQYLQQASTSTSGSPLDSWFPASKNIKPQISDQFSLGFFKNIKKNVFEFSAEIYYKNLQNVIDFKDHASMLMNKFIESQVRSGNGRSYGLELMINKTSGKINGWCSYTLSRAERKINGINDDKYFLSPYDRTYNFSLVLMYELTKKWELSGNLILMSGQAFTSPVGKYEYLGAAMPLYSGRNQDRMPFYHRMDIGATYKGKQKPNKIIHGSWNFSVYNVYNSKNPMFMYFKCDEKGNPSKAVIYYLPIIPAISYNLTF